MTIYFRTVAHSPPNLAKQIILLAVDTATLNASSVLPSSIALLTVSQDSFENI